MTEKNFEIEGQCQESKHFTLCLRRAMQRVIKLSSSHCAKSQDDGIYILLANMNMNSWVHKRYTTLSLDKIYENNLLTIPYPCCNCPGGSCLFLWLIMNNNGRPYVCTRCVCVPFHIFACGQRECMWTINWTTLRNFCTPVTSIQMRLKNTFLLLVTQACQMCAFDVNISSNMITAGTLEKKTV